MQKLPSQPSLSEGLLFIREEEKVARDSYITLGDDHGLVIFDNIAVSEQTHMERDCGSASERYGPACRSSSHGRLQSIESLQVIPGICALVLSTPENIPFFDHE